MSEVRGSEPKAKYGAVCLGCVARRSVGVVVLIGVIFLVVSQFLCVCLCCVCACVNDVWLF